MGSSVPPLTGLHIAVVEDDEDARQIVIMVLEYFGALVTSTGTGSAALALLAHVAPDVVVLDMQLPDRDGRSLVRAARRRGLTTPFIAVSARDFDEHALRQEGFSAYLRKPLDHTALVNAILAAVARGGE